MTFTTPSGAGTPDADLLVIGGGINGAGIARDAAGRGLRVVLCDMGDLAQGTSSRSSRLIHGGLRYLEFGELRLVREALREREILMSIAPHLVHPVTFVLPHVPQMRPAWMLRAGLFLYDHLARRRRLAPSRSIRLHDEEAGEAVRPEIARGFTYSDCRTDDARLTLLNARSAADLGARILTRTEFTGAQAIEGAWEAQLRHAHGGAGFALRARAIVNAAGPWVERIAHRIGGTPPPQRVRLVKGSHIVVPKFWRGDHAYLLQNSDRRAIFVIPYEGEFALIGTTDIAYEGAAEAVAITDEESLYLCDAVNAQLCCALSPADVCHAYSGVRCLVDDDRANPSAVTREYQLDLDRVPGDVPVLTVLGGKITTYRHLAERAVDMLRPWFADLAPSTSAARKLPGGDLDVDRVEDERAALVEQFAFLPREHVLGLFDRHGSQARAILEGTNKPGDLGVHFGAGLYEREVDHLRRREWAQTAQDVLWRRTKFGLRLTREQQGTLERYMNDEKY
jgi:glycerol-3-phosphate dehydrogenase